MAAAKVPIIKAVDGNEWKLGQFGMTSKYGKGSYRFVSRAEVQTLLRDQSDIMFTGPQIYGRDFMANPSTWRFRKHSDGRVSFGCQTFAASAVKLLKKWAQVR